MLFLKKYEKGEFKGGNVIENTEKVMTKKKTEIERYRYLKC
jgi:hypothetical protein